MMNNLVWRGLITGVLLVTVSAVPLSAQNVWKGDAATGGTNFSNAASWTLGRAPNVGEALVFSSTNLAVSTTLYNDLPGWKAGNFTFNSGAPALIVSGNKFANNANWTVINNSGLTQTIAADVDLFAGGFNYNNGTTRGSLLFTGVVSTTVNSGWSVGDMVGGTLAFTNFSTDANRVLDWWGRNPKGATAPAAAYTGTNRPTVVFGNLSGGGEIRQAGMAYNIVINGENTGISFVFTAAADVLLDYTNSNTAKLSSRASTIRYGTISLLGGSFQDSMGVLTIGGGNLNNGSGGGMVRIQHADAGTATLVADNLTRSDRSVLDLGESNLFGNKAGSATNITPWITVGNDNSAGRDWAVLAGSGTGYADKLYVAYTAYGDINTASSNALLTDGASLSAGITLNTLKINTSAAGQALDLGGNTLILAANGLLFTGADDYTISGGMLRSGNGNQEIVLWQSGTGQLTISATLGVGGGGLTVAGSGTLRIDSANTYSGYTTLNGGQVILGHDLAFGSGTDAMLVMNAGTLDLNGHDLSVAAFLGFGYGENGAAVINSGETPVTLSIGGSSSTLSRRAGFSGVQNTYFGAGVNLILSGTNGGNLINKNDNDSVTFSNNRKAQTGNNIYNSVSVADAAALAAATGTVIFAGDGGFMVGDNQKMDNFTQHVTVSGTGNYINIENPALTFTGAWDGDGELMIRATRGSHITRLNGDLSAFTGTFMHLNTGNMTTWLYTETADVVNHGALLAATADYRGITYIDNTAAGNRTQQIGELATAAADSDGNLLVDGTLGNVLVRNTTNNTTLTLEIGGGDFAGSITNNGSVTDTANHVFNDTTTTYVTALTKVGTGTLTLSNLNTYTGTTTVSGGVLLLSGTLSRTAAVKVSGGALRLLDSGTIAGSQAIEVEHGALLVDTAYEWMRKVDLGADGVLGGNGTIGTGNINFLAASAGSAGVTGGELGTTGTLTFSVVQEWGDFTYYFDILSAADHDLLNFSAGLDLKNSDQITLNVNNLGGLTEFNNVNILSGQLDNYDESKWQLDAGFSLFYDTGKSELLLSYVTIPEPSTWLLLGAGATLLVFLRRRR
ncbi:MAG: autotransporter-associated beta strand repeat-containing protein [Verrucomicrobiales bacterium]|jgi:autotransporter-associated beta strand protein|nr:autotransporter-associated beta strand repeat-containing protein [Verrucomicrobiales bacterium]